MCLSYLIVFFSVNFAEGYIVRNTDKSFLFFAPCEENDLYLNEPKVKKAIARSIWQC